jgi:4-carboxymuconolactone decarboxylase
MPTQRTPMRAPWRDIAPDLSEITDRVLFDDVWQRPGLSPRDRSLVTVGALIAGYRQNELPFHIRKAIENGVTRDEVIEVITHLAFYSGWPAASTALTIARDVFRDTAQPRTISKEHEDAEA